jgi:hypothetical protein
MTIKPTTRLCRSCQQEKPWNATHFCKDRTKPHGLSTICRECNRQRLKARYHADLDASREQDHRRYRDDPARQASVKARAMRHYKANTAKVKEHVAARKKARREAGLPPIIDPEKLARAKERDRQRNKQRYHANIEQSRAKERARVRSEGDKARVREWKKDNPGKVRGHNYNRRKLLHASKEHFTKQDVCRLRQAQKGLCHYCDRPMTKTGRLAETIDHLTPVTRGGSNGPENIVLACWECNMAKSDRTAEEFLARTDRPPRT